MAFVPEKVSLLDQQKTKSLFGLIFRLFLFWIKHTMILRFRILRSRSLKFIENLSEIYYFQLEHLTFLKSHFGDFSVFNLPNSYEA